MMNNASCQCGEAAFRIEGQPLMRGYCHCTICQRFNEAPFADITIFRRRDVVLPEAARVAYQNYTSPPMVNRGKCVACGKPAVETLSLPLMPDLVIVPSANIEDASLLPAAGMHIFYDTRQADVDDALPKYSGFVRSQLAFSWRLLKALMRRA